MEIRVQDLLFIDLEASSLSQISWPIEIGISRIEGRNISTWSSLIRPDLEWDPRDWSIASQSVHNIRRLDLDDAPPAVDVARSVLERFSGKILVSDNPQFDGRWTDVLFSTIDQSSPEFIDFDLVAFGLGNDRAIDAVYEKLHRTRVPHRAGPDAHRMAAAVEHGLQVARNCHHSSGPAPEH